jgi:hypothetical protein
MAKIKDELIKEIKTVISSLNSSIGSTKLLSSANKILEYLYELDSIDNGVYDEAIKGLNHTIEEDIYYASEAEKEMFKKNAPKVRATEYHTFMNKAINLIHYNISSVIK